MKVFKTEIARSVYVPEQFKDEPYFQIAFAGRSNVGKSSMINCLLQKKDLARTSSQPGKTRSINYFKINDRFYFVDLPGYGYAKVSRQEKEKWKVLIENYFLNNSKIKALIQIIDAKIGITDKDAAMIGFSQASSLPILIVATKTDKLNQNEKTKQLQKIANQMQQLKLNEMMPFSAKTKLGKPEIWKWIEGKI